MNAPAKLKTVEKVIDAMDARAAGLLKLREKFPDAVISKLPKETKKQSEERRAGNNIEWKCQVCGGMHHKNATHLDYVGHAALTDRLLDVDPEWSWEPVAFGPNGLPQLDQNGGLWIRLTVLGVTRLGYGDADGKTGGNAIKEAIGDALRNAGMRFGAALDLWHKGDLHADDENEPKNNARQAQSAPKHDEPLGPQFITVEQRDRIQLLAEAAEVEVRSICERVGIDNLLQLHADMFDKVVSKLRKQAEEKAKAAGDVLDDEVGF